MSTVKELFALIPPEILEAETFVMVAKRNDQLQFFFAGEHAVVADMMPQALKAMFDAECSYQIQKSLSPQESPGFIHIT